MKTILMATAFVLAQGALLAADPTPFPNADGSGDFTTAAAWGGTLPGTSEAISFSTNVYNKTVAYKGTADATFGKMTVMTKKATFDLTGKNLKIAVPGLAVYGEVRQNDWQSSNASVDFKGGVWNLGAKMLSTCNTSSDQRGNDRLVQFSSGAVVTNAGYVRVSYKEHRHTLRFTGDGTKFFATNVEGFDYGATGKSNAFEVVSGATANFSSHYRDTTGSAAPTSDTRVWYRTLVSGEGSSLTVGGQLSIGNYYGGCSLEVLDGATVKSSTSIRLGSVPHAPDNRILVANGATLRGPVHLGGYSNDASSGNEMVVSNATYAGYRVTLGQKAGGKSQRLVFRGSETQVTYTFDETVFPIFALSPCSEFILDDGFVWTYGPDNIYYCNADSVSSSNTVRILNGAKWQTGNGTIFHAGGRTATCLDNRLEIGNEAELSTGVFRTAGTGNRVTVSNGTLKATSTFARALEIGYVGDSGEASDNVLVLAGRSPKVDVAGGLVVTNGSSLVFAMPTDGFDASAPLVEAASCTFSPDATIAFEGLSALVGKSDLPERMTLVRADQAIVLTPAQLDAANAQFAAAGLSAFLVKAADGGRELVLTTRQKGLSVLVR